MAKFKASEQGNQPLGLVATSRPYAYGYLNAQVWLALFASFHAPM